MRAGHLVAERYRLDEKIGSGGMGTVWRATDLELGRSVAIKWAKPDEDDPSGRQPRREARIAAGLQHPHIVALFDVVREDGNPLLVMEYVPSRSLAEIIREHGPLALAEVARIGAQIASGLAALHTHGIVHGDVKPANVLLSDNGTAKLTDFGISRVVSGELTRTDSDMIGGTPRFMAPEVANGRKPTPAADMFSFGAMLLAAIEGNPGPGEESAPAWRRAERRELWPPAQAGTVRPLLAELLRLRSGDRPSAEVAQTRLEDAVRATEPDGGGLSSASVSGKSLTSNRKRVTAIAGISVATVAVASWAVAGTLGATPTGHSAATAPPAVAPVHSRNNHPAKAMLVGDPRSADPCALADPAAFTRFGRATKSRDQGNFNRCDVLIESRGSALANVKFEFENPPEAGSGPNSALEKSGDVGILRLPASTDQCERTLVLADGYRIDITASQSEHGTADFCAVADAATITAAAVANRGSLPRRAAVFSPSSLALVDACSLLDGAALGALPGIDALRPEVGFGNWECRWNSTTGPYSIHLRFDHNGPLNADDGQPVKLGGRAGFITQDGDGDNTCLARVVQRTYQGADGQATDELLYLVVTGPAPANKLCAPATALAKSAATKLPTP